MKKLIVGLSVLCMCAILSIPVTASFANSSDVNDVPTTNVVNEEKKALTKEEALKIVEAMEPGLGFDYMGDENTYECIKEKGIEGYVFLPQCEGDMAYLVDKNTNDVYFFHPSGYFELL